MLQIIQDAKVFIRTRGMVVLGKLLAAFHQHYDMFTNVPIHHDCCSLRFGNMRYDDIYAVFVSILLLCKGC